jgi:hypothetical protein
MGVPCAWAATDIGNALMDAFLRLDYVSFERAINVTWK